MFAVLSILAVALPAPITANAAQPHPSSTPAVRPAQAPTRQGLDAYVQEQMRRTGVASVSLAIIDGGRIVRVETYGLANRATGARARANTLYQAASISKPFAAVAALQLVEMGRLSLDGDVNQQLREWQLTDAATGAAVPVTLRQLLSHTAGTTVSGLRGYAPGEPVPTLRQSLDGVAPANNVPIRVRGTPGAQWAYSGGGYLVTQLLVEQASRRPFDEQLTRMVLVPAGMRNSTYHQPLPADALRRAAHGYYDDGAPVPGGAHTYPELGAGGLWTTPSDLARFVIQIQNSISGVPGSLLRRETAEAAMQVQAGTAGLGFEVRGEGRARRFNHGGRNQGFDSEMVGYMEGGDGAVVMLNGNDTAGMLTRIVQYIGEAYGWPGYPPLWRPPVADPTVPGAALNEAEGRYEFIANRMVTLSRVGNALLARRGNGGGAYYDTLIPVGRDRFVGLDNPFRYAIRRNPAGQIVGITREPAAEQGESREYGRIGPLFDSRAPLPDQPEEEIDSLIQTLRRLSDAALRGTSTEGLAPGLSQALGSASISELAGIHSIRLRGRGDVRGRAIVRHGSEIASVAYFDAEGTVPPRRLIVYYDDAGRLADYDLAAH
jgi:CubicO group peptidase (beta-lactamase class C family)